MAAVKNKDVIRSYALPDEKQITWSTLSIDIHHETLQTLLPPPPSKKIFEYGCGLIVSIANLT